MNRNTFFENLDRNGLPTGGRKAYWAYKLSIEDRSNILELCDHLTEPEAVDFIDVLRKAGITQFVLTDRSTSLFATVLALTANGCTIRGTKVVVAFAAMMADSGNQPSLDCGLSSAKKCNLFCNNDLLLFPTRVIYTVQG